MHTSSAVRIINALCGA